MLKRAKNNKGMSLIETLPFFITLSLMMTMVLGYFGILHKAVLNSISARAYIFETLRHRQNVRYLRDVNSGNAHSYQSMRLHFINEQKGQNQMTAAKVSTRHPSQSPYSDPEDVHRSQVYTVLDRERNTDVLVDHVWIKVSYGICLDSECGGEN